MARYPTFEEYHEKSNYHDGIQRCDDLLRKSPNDIQLLTTKFQLLNTQSEDDSNAVLDQLASLPTPIQDLTDICQIEMAVVEARAHLYPPRTTAGPQVAKLWEHAVKATGSMNRSLDIVSTRWERAVFDGRLGDMQQALIQLKALQPRNRVVYMAHAALTQMLSRRSDDLQAKLALGLARKAVSERFDEDAKLDCRVPGQIFAKQGSEGDVRRVEGGRFAESKQIWDELKRLKGVEANGQSTTEVSHAAHDEGVVAEIAQQKAHFAELIQTDAAVDTIRSFAADAIALFSKAMSANTGVRRSPADAAFLAISAIVRVWEQTSHQHYLIHAAAVAESLLRFNEHIHEARLILVYLYMRLGLASLAIRFFDSLSVKEIQHDTVGHVLFTRLSLLHPHATLVKTRETYDPLRQLRRALDVYVRCEDKLADTEAGVLHHGQTGMLFDLHELRDTLKFSLARRIMALEWRRAGRLMKNKSEAHDSLAGMGPQVVRNWMEARDNRDLNAAFDHGYNVERVLHGVDGQVPGGVWVAYGLAADSAWALATGQTSAAAGDVQAWEATMTDVQTKARSSAGPATAPGMTETEFAAGELAYHTLRMLLLHRADDAPKLSDAVPAVSTALGHLQIDTLVGSDAALAETLLAHYAYTDVLRTCIAACDTVTPSAAPAQREALSSLQKRAREAFATLARHATEQQARVKTPAVRQLMAWDEGVWEAVLGLGSAGEMDRFCEAVAGSAREGWEGVGKVKMV